MNATHTPGPWNIRTARNDEGYGLLICDEDQTILSRMDTWLGKTPEAAMEANARLIAAAPELLAALEGAERVLSCKTVHVDEITGEALSPLMIEIRAAIAKAKQA